MSSSAEIATDGSDSSGGASPLVSVVTVYYNRAAVLHETLDSILAQSMSDFELIVVDDGSTDDTLARLRTVRDPRLRIIALENGGFTGAINAGIRASRGEYVAIQGSGDVSHPDRLREQVRVLAEKPEVSVVGCHVESDSDLDDSTILWAPRAGIDRSKALMTRKALFTHGEVMFRRATWDQVGGYREFFRFAQDRDLWLRMFEIADYDVVPKILYRRRKLAGGVSTDPVKMIQQAYLADFAIQCARSRRESGFDPLDRYGHLATFFRRPSRELSARFARLGALRMVLGGEEAGWQLARLALREGVTPRALFVFCVGWTHKYGWLWKGMGKPVLKAAFAAARREARSDAR